MYVPETPFILTDDYSLIYNLKHNGYFKGVPVMVNDVCISFGLMKHDENRKEIAKVILDKLNDLYFNEVRVIAESNPSDDLPPASGGPVNRVVGRASTLGINNV